MCFIFCGHSDHTFCSIFSTWLFIFLLLFIPRNSLHIMVIREYIIWNVNTFSQFFFFSNGVIWPYFYVVKLFVWGDAFWFQVMVTKDVPKMILLKQQDNISLFFKILQWFSLLLGFKSTTMRPPTWSDPWISVSNYLPLSLLHPRHSRNTDLHAVF